MGHIEYRYRPDPWNALLVTLLFGMGAVVIAHEALTNDRGLILNGIIRFTPGGATIFYWCLAASSAAFAAIGIPLFFVGLFSKRVLTITATEISAPKVWSAKYTVVPLKDVKRIDVHTVRRQRLLRVYHSNGKFSIAQSMLPNADAFESIYRTLATRVGGN